MSGMTIKQALAVIQTEVNYHAGSDTHYRAERLEQSLTTLRAALAKFETRNDPPRAQQPAANADAWKDAVDHELTVFHSTADSFANPREAVRALIDWHISVERDPAVSEMARDAERYRHLFECPEPFCYRGDVFDSKQEADAAIDQARGKGGQEVGDA